MSLALNRQWFYCKVNAIFKTNTNKEETIHENKKSGMKSYLFGLPQPVGSVKW